METTGLMIALITSPQLISGTALITCDSHSCAMQTRISSPLMNLCMGFMVLVLNTNAAILVVCVTGFLSGKMESYSKIEIHNQANSSCLANSLPRRQVEDSSVVSSLRARPPAAQLIA